MKKITIYKRMILERTRFKKWRYKEVDQVSIIYDGKEWKNHDQNIDNKRLQKPFKIILYTRKKEELKKYIDKLNRTESDTWQKSVLIDLINNNNK